MERKKHRETVQ